EGLQPGARGPFLQRVERLLTGRVLTLQRGHHRPPPLTSQQHTTFRNVRTIHVVIRHTNLLHDTTSPDTGTGHSTVHLRLNTAHPHPPTPHRVGRTVTG